MSRDKTTTSTLTLSDLLKLKEKLDEMLPEFNTQELDQFIAAGIEIEEVVLITPIPHFEKVPRLKTKHGILAVKYTKHAPFTFVMKNKLELPIWGHGNE